MIFISAGHHEIKKGASFDGFTEHDEAKIWCSILQNFLGHEAMLVPVGTLRHKVNFINEFPTKDMHNIALEIHFNSAVVGDKHVGNGCEVLYYPGSETGKDIAERLSIALSNNFPPNRGAKEGWYRMNPKNGADFFLKRVRYPAVILEPEFIHHKELIQYKREAACRALAEALQGMVDD